QQNVRFWHYCNLGWVKLKLTPEKPLTIYHRWDNGEGTSWESDTYEIDGSRVVDSWARGATDCDGRVRSGGTLFCEINKLQTNTPYEPS
ncbi:hypothetical protein ACI3PL_23095, partial [Lacticaseibacillus paracasei]